MTHGEVMLSEAQRAITRQEADLDSLRDRANRLLAGAALLAGLFAVATSDTDGWHTWTKVAAIASVLGVGAVTLYIEWPKDWMFETQLGKLFDELRESRSTGAEHPHDVALDIAQTLDDNNNANMALLAPRMKAYRIGIWLVALEIALWIATVAPVWGVDVVTTP